MLSQLAENLKTLRRLRGKPYLNYTRGERFRLAFPGRFQHHRARLLNFNVNYLSEEWYRYLSGEIFIEGEYFFESETDSPVIMDCGANIGLATLFFKRLYPKARILAFEADPVAAGILRRNIDQNHLQNVSAHNLMLADADGMRSFYVASDEAGSPLMSTAKNRISNSRKISVKAGRLSEFVDSPIDLLKLDVEGSEFDVLTDLKSSGKLSQIRKMIIEYHHKIDGQSSRLARFLALLEEGEFEYQISCSCEPVTGENMFQDILIGAYRDPLARMQGLSCLSYSG